MDRRSVSTEGHEGGSERPTHGVLFRRLLADRELCRVERFPLKQPAENAVPVTRGADLCVTLNDESGVAIFLEENARLLFLFLMHTVNVKQVVDDLLYISRTDPHIFRVEGFVRRAHPWNKDSLAHAVSRRSCGMVSRGIVPDPPPLVPAGASSSSAGPSSSSCAEPSLEGVHTKTSSFFLPLKLISKGEISMKAISRIGFIACAALRRHIPLIDRVLSGAAAPSSHQGRGAEDESEELTLDQDSCGLASNLLHCLVFSSEVVDDDGLLPPRLKTPFDASHVGNAQMDLLEQEGDRNCAVSTEVLLRFPHVAVSHRELLMLVQEVARDCEEDTPLRQQTGNFFKMIFLEALHVDYRIISTTNFHNYPWKLVAVLDPLDGPVGTYQLWDSPQVKCYRSSILRTAERLVHDYAAATEGDTLPGEPPEGLDVDSSLTTLEQLKHLWSVRTLESGDCEPSVETPPLSPLTQFTDSISQSSITSRATSFSGASSHLSMETRDRVKTQAFHRSFQDSIHSRNKRSFYGFMGDLFFLEIDPWEYDNRSLLLEHREVLRASRKLRQRVLDLRQHEDPYAGVRLPAVHPPLSLFTSPFKIPTQGDILDPVTGEWSSKDERTAIARTIVSKSRKTEVFVDLVLPDTLHYVETLRRLVASTSFFPEVNFMQVLAVFPRELLFPEEGGPPPWVTRLNPHYSGREYEQLWVAQELPVAPKRFVARLCGPNSGKCVGHRRPSNPRVPSKKRQGPLIDDHERTTVYHPENHVTLHFTPHQVERDTSDKNQRAMRDALGSTGSVNPASRSLQEDRMRYLRRVILSIECPVQRKERRLYCFGDNDFMKLFGQQWNELISLQRSFQEVERRTQERYLLWARSRFGPRFQATGLATGSLQGILSRMQSLRPSRPQVEETEEEQLGIDPDIAGFQANLAQQQHEAIDYEARNEGRTRQVQISVEDMLRGPTEDQIRLLEKSAPWLAGLTSNWGPVDIPDYKILMERTCHKTPRDLWSRRLLERVLERGMSLPEAGRPHRPSRSARGRGKSGRSSQHAGRGAQDAPSTVSVDMTLEEFLNEI